MRSNVNIRSHVIKVDPRPPLEDKPYTEVEIAIDAGSILVCFTGAAAETAAKLEPGDVVNVDGALRERRWETIRDGSRSRVVVDGMRFTRIPKQRPKVVQSLA